MMRLRLCIATFGLIGAAHAVQTPAELQPILIGQIASLTGNNPGGKDNMAGAALAVSELNAAGGLLGGRRIVLALEDDRTKPDEAAAAFSRLAARRVVAVVGTSFSNASLAVIPLAEAAKIPHISTGAADTQVEPVRPYTFITSLTGQIVAERLLRYLGDHELRRIAVVFDADSVFARTAWAKQKAMLANSGITLLIERSVKVDTTDFKSVLDEIASSGAEAVMLWLTGPPAVGFVRSYAQAGVPIPLFASQGMASPSFIAQVGDGAEGITMATAPAMVASQLPRSKLKRVATAMTVAFARTNGYAPSQFAIDGYVAVKLIAAAISKAGSDDPFAIRAALEQLVLLTPQGEYHYSAENHSGLRPEEVTIVKIHDRKFVLTSWSREQIVAARNR
jgi:branched-chain amino acid transport system substrate-binding protein